MNGQWIGECEGTDSFGNNHKGKMYINVDELPSHFEGAAYFIPENLSFPESVVFFETENKERNFEFRTKLLWNRAHAGCPASIPPLNSRRACSA
jgi:hypothetical protein